MTTFTVAEQARDTTSSFGAAAWEAIASIREQIDRLPLLTGLADGTLPREVFAHYLEQDTLYLGDYSRALSVCSSRANDIDEQIFWARSAERALVVEAELHATHVHDIEAASMSPTCAAYTSFLLAVSGRGSYPELAAAILPCFWIYQDVGERLHEQVGHVADHPYGDWIDTYADPVFAEATMTARSIVDRLAAHADEATVQRMHAAFHRASQYEWMFWDAAHRRETWPI